jgi:two-component system, response regulator PdtaR
MTTSASHTPTVLIVEDEMMIAMHMSMIIENLGYRLAGIAVDKETALALSNDEIDIALIDCNLRDGVTGPEIGHHLAIKKNTTIVYVTANPQQIVDEHQHHDAILGVYPKPVNDNDVSEIVKFALSKRSGQTIDRVPMRLQLL